jgi:PBSX family phage terminase large subunit
MSDPRKWRAFASYYVQHFNASKAAKQAGFSAHSAGNQGYLLLQNPKVRVIIDEMLAGVHLSAEEALKLLADIARGDVGEFLNVEKDGTVSLDLSAAKDKTKLIKRIKNKKVIYNGKNMDREIHTEEIELYSALDAIDKVLRVYGKYTDNLNINAGDKRSDAPFVLPADMIAPSFSDVYRDIVQNRHTEYIFSGGRGSTKSSFISLAFIYLIKNNPLMHGLAMRQVANTLRDSVYAQLQWAVSELGLSDEFKCTSSPMEIERLATGQKIYFRGADDPGKIKSITPTFGHIGLVWFEELDQFHGENAIRKIEQSIRGGDEIYYFKSFNPPPTKANWANKYLEIPKANQYQHKSTYLTVPPEWLGRTWLEEAEHLKNTNLTAYENEYLGLATNDGGLVFTNVRIEKITDEQIAQFDRVLHGVDWGFYPDPFSFGKMHYDAARRILYVFGEARYWKKSNRDALTALADGGLITKVEDKKEKTVSYPELIIADSAEPKSVQDFRAYGANCRGAEKGSESVKYSIKWLQGLTAIVIDNQRAPYHAEEFLNYEYERTRDDEIINEFPDKNNHAIDDVRYATNLIWRKRGE